MLDMANRVPGTELSCLLGVLQRAAASVGVGTCVFERNSLITIQQLHCQSKHNVDLLIRDSQDAHDRQLSAPFASPCACASVCFGARLLQQHTKRCDSLTHQQL